MGTLRIDKPLQMLIDPDTLREQIASDPDLPCEAGRPAAICSTCDNVTARTRSLDGWRWRCLMFPVEDIDHFLGEGVRATEPHGRCLDKNRTEIGRAHV